MRVDWKQSLEGLSLLEIRNHLRAIARSYTNSFSVDAIVDRLEPNTARPKRSTRERAQRLLDGLAASGLVERNTDIPQPRFFDLTTTGRSLCAASAKKRFGRARADAAIEKLLAEVRRINSDPIFLHDVEWVAIYGSYINGADDLGDIDTCIKLKHRWTPGEGTDTDRTRRAKVFEERYPPPASFYERYYFGFWPEEYTTRLLRRVDPGIQLIEPTTLQTLGCPHRVIFPEVKDVPAKQGWSFERSEVVLRPAEQQSPID